MAITWAAVNFKNHATSLSSKSEPTIWSRGTGQRYIVLTAVNSSFRSCLKPLYQSEAWCTTIHMKMSLIYMWMKSHFHMKRWAPRLALRKRLKVIRKWPISYSMDVQNQRCAYDNVDILLLFKVLACGRTFVRTDSFVPAKVFSIDGLPHFPRFWGSVCEPSARRSSAIVNGFNENSVVQF